MPLRRGTRAPPPAVSFSIIPARATAKGGPWREPDRLAAAAALPGFAGSRALGPVRQSVFSVHAVAVARCRILIGKVSCGFQDRGLATLPGCEALLERIWRCSVLSMLREANAGFSAFGLGNERSAP